ncbi:hypothetical protein [Rhizorhabdus sp.]|uniref:hypothetical protein n=1 Tax=Rhizorhabdus sp. TaxID=1968843 RepID=UPI0035ADF163
MTDRPNCLIPTACQARTRKHCRSCAAKAVAARPEERAKRSAVTKARFQSAHFRAKHRRALERTYEEKRQDPEWLAKRQADGARLQEILSRPEIRAKTYSPEVNAKRGAACQERWLGWCPPEYRAQYRRLVGSFKFKAAEAKQMILELVRADEEKLRRGIVPESLRA